MKLRKLKYGCEHDRFEAHGYGCPGGVFLPDSAESIDWCVQHNLIGEGPDHCEDGDPDAPRSDWCRMVEALLVLPEIAKETP